MEKTQRPDVKSIENRATYNDPDNYPAHSVHQPYAGLFQLAAYGLLGKDIEVRPKRIRYRGPLVMCASKNIDREAYLRVQRILVGGGIMKMDDFDRACGTSLCGHAAAIFHVRDVRPLLPEDHERAFTTNTVIDYETPFSWVAETITALKPFPVMGKQGFFRVPRTAVDAARGASSTLAQRELVRQRCKRASDPRCDCGRPLPKNLAEFMNNLAECKHGCECGREWLVQKMQFVSAERVRKELVA